MRGDRQCDTAQPGGYCTVLSCGANACPGGGACLAFQTTVAGCPYTDRAVARTARSYCLKTCGDDGDCREGYACVTPAERDALVLDDRQDVRVCLPVAPASSLPVPAADSGAPVCQPSVDASVPIPVDPPADGGEGGAPDGGAPDGGAPDGEADGGDGGDAG